MQRSTLQLTMTLAILTAALLVPVPAVAAPDAAPDRSASPQLAPAQDLSPDEQDIAFLDRVSSALTRVARAARPSVVSVRTRTPLSRDRYETGSGSGVIFDDRGHIVTSCHVIEGAPQIDVTLADGRRLRAELVGKDPKTDVAVLRISARNITPARFADSSRVEVGQLVLAIGSPFALAQTVTHGIVSATGRTDVDMDEMEYQNFIQTDAATNPGNSGGALVNTRGQVIGINTAIASKSGGFSGIAFATPSNTVLWAARGIISGRPLVRGYLGVGIAPLLTEIATRAGLTTTLGVLISSVAENSPARRAGLRENDIVLQINGSQVADHAQLQTLIAEQPPGTRTVLTIWREGTQRDIEVLVGEQPREL